MRCPQCHRPLADDDGADRICCADASRLWRCAQCGQTSEGFAFAYGAVPALRRHARSRWTRAAAGRGRGARQACAWPSRSSSAGAPSTSAPPPTAPTRQLRALFGRFARDGGRAHGDARRGATTSTRRRRRRRCAWRLAALFADVEHRPQDPDNLFRIAIGAGAARGAASSPSARRWRDAGSADAAPVPRTGGRGTRARRAADRPSYARWRAGRPGPARRRRRSRAAAARRRRGRRR